MRDYKFETYDVFTDQHFAGNPLAVVLDAQGLSSEEMQTITREFNLAETSFVLPPEDPAHTARVRIFTLGYEMPFAGHPTVGTAIAIARARGLVGEIKLELNAGLFPVNVAVNGEGGFAEFQNPNLPSELGAAPDAKAIEAALSLPSGSVDTDRHKPRRVGAGVNYICVRAALQVVRDARLNVTAFEALALEETVGVYLYAEGGDKQDASYHARMFAPNAGIAEDPATGSAAAALPGQIALSENLPDGEQRWIIEQGYEMGRPSRIEARVTIENSLVVAVRIGGSAVPMQQGTISF